MGCMNESLKRALSASGSLPTIPSVAVEVLNLVREDCGLGDLVPVLSRDPALVAKLIRYGNSPVYRRAQPVSSIKQAVMLLGLHATVIVALSFSLVDALRPATAGSLNYGWVWRRTLLAAAAARFVARMFGVARHEEAFLAAMLQDVGMMMLDRSGLGVYDDVGDRQSDHLMLSVLERSRAKTSHAQVGAWMLRSWRFPEDVCTAVERSHDLAVLSHARDEPTLEWCVAYSGVLADAILEEDPRGLTAALAWADGFAPSPGTWHQAVMEHMAGVVLETEALFESSLAPNLVELMNASKELMAERSLDPAPRLR